LKVGPVNCEETVRNIVVVNFPSFIVVDDKGNDFWEAL